MNVPKADAETTKLYNSLTKEMLDNEKVELLQFSNKVIYQETGSRSRYFLIQESAWGSLMEYKLSP
jgi:pyoverdine/dityrosine biosynthesis protein Dit1